MNALKESNLRGCFLLTMNLVFYIINVIEGENMEKSKLISSKIESNELIGYLKYAGEMDNISRRLTMRYETMDDFSEAYNNKILNEIKYCYKCFIICYYKSEYICTIYGTASSNLNHRPGSCIKVVNMPEEDEIEKVITDSIVARRVIIKDLKITQEKYNEFCNNTLDLKILDEKRKIESISRDIKGYRNSIKKLETEKALHKIALDNLVLQRDGIKAKGKTKKLKNNNEK